MNLKMMFCAGLAAAAMGPLAAQAQSVSQDVGQAQDQTQPAAASAAASGVPTSAAMSPTTDQRDPTAPVGSAANPIPQSSPTPTAAASALQAGDPTVVSNGPVPDTRANRAHYGQPMSRAGRLTQPVGD